MTYYFSKTLTLSFEAAVQHTVETLKKEGYGPGLSVSIVFLAPRPDNVFEMNA